MNMKSIERRVCHMAFVYYLRKAAKWTNLRCDSMSNIRKRDDAISVIHFQCKSTQSIRNEVNDRILRSLRICTKETKKKNDNFIHCMLKTLLTLWEQRSIVRPSPYLSIKTVLLIHIAFVTRNLVVATVVVIVVVVAFISNSKWVNLTHNTHKTHVKYKLFQ